MKSAMIKLSKLINKMQINNKRKIGLQRLNLVRFYIKSESYFYKTWCACRPQCSCTDQKCKKRTKRTSLILLCIHAGVQVPKLTKYRYLSIYLYLSLYIV